MQLDPEWLQSDGEDAQLLFWIGSAFVPKPPPKIGVAVSGGGDSMALLHLYQRWAMHSGHKIAVVTVDHGLRPEARAEAEAVAAYCAEAGISHDILTWSGWDGAGNLQAKAREARYGLLADWAKANDIGGVALGHTQDDIAETFVMRLARKAGVDGLAAMDKQWDADGVRWVRPLCFVAREELRDYLTRHGVDWVDDPSNDDPQFERVRVRQALAGLADLGIDTETLQQTAFNLQMARSALEHYTLIEADTHIEQVGGDIILKRKPPLPSEIERRLFSKAVQWVGRRAYPPRSSQLEQLERGLATVEKATACGCVVVREGRHICIMREHAAVNDLTCPSDGIWDGKWRLDGPHAEGLMIRALGETGLSVCPGWRETGFRRASLIASPAVFSGENLIAAPLAGFENGWKAQIVADFASSLTSH